MYLTELYISNLRALRTAKLNFEPGDETGWHVVIGENSSGKSTIVRAFALGLLGPQNFTAIRMNWRFWTKHKAEFSRLTLRISRSKKWDPVDTVETSLGKDRYTAESLFGISFDPDYFVLSYSVVGGIAPWNRHPCRGLFSASFGPYRRISGRTDNRVMLDERDKVARHITTFDENSALSECVHWICNLYVLTLEKRADSKLLEQIKRFVEESQLLPDGAKIASIKSDSVSFLDGFGTEVPIEELSDGFRSILSLAFELIRQLVQCYGAKKVFAENKAGELIVAPPGVVAIDEIDTHLHPSWQARIGDWFTRRFPNIQFIVTTHSPFICRAAKTIWHLSNPAQRREGAPDIQEITGEDKNRLIYGNIIEAYESAGFDLASLTRSEAGRKKKDRLATLARKKLRGLEMSTEESKEFEELVKLFPGSVAGA